MQWLQFTGNVSNLSRNDHIQRWDSIIIVLAAETINANRYFLQLDITSKNPRRRLTQNKCFLRGFFTSL